MATILAVGDDSTPSSVSTRTASRTSYHVFAPPSMPVVVHCGVQRDVDGADVLLFPHSLRVGDAWPRGFESSSDETIHAGSGIHVPVKLRGWRGKIWPHEAWNQIAGKIYEHTLAD